MHLVASPSPLDLAAVDLLEGHVALVAGGETRIGRAVADELVRCGAEVVIASGESSDRVVDAVLERHGRIDTLLIDVMGGDDELARACVERALAPGGGGTIVTVVGAPAERIAVEERNDDWARRWAADGVGVVALSLGEGGERDLSWLPALVGSALGRSLNGSTIAVG